MSDNGASAESPPEPEDGSASASSNRYSRWIRGLALLPVTLLLAVVVIVIGARLYLTDDRLTSLVQDVLHETFRGKFSIQRLGWRLPLHVELDKFSAKTPAGVEVLAIERVRVDASIAGILAKRIGVNVKELHGLRVDVIDDGQGNLNILEAFEAKKPSEPGEPPPPFTIVTQLNLRDGGLRYRAPGRQVNSRGLEVDAHATITLPKTVKAKADVRLERTDVTQAEPKIAISSVGVAIKGARFDSDGTPDGSKAGVEDLQVTLPGGRVNLRAALDDLAFGPGTDIDVETMVKLDLDELKPIFPPEVIAQNPQGKLQVELEAKGSLLEANANLVVSGQGASVAGVPFEGAHAQASLNAGKLDLSRLDLRVPGGVVHATGRAEIGANGIPHALTIELSPLPLRTLATPFVPDPKQVPEAVAGKVTIEGKNVQPFDTAVRLNLAVTGIQGIPGLPSRLGIDGQVELQGQTVAIRRLQVGSSSVAVDLVGRASMSPAGPLALQLDVQHRNPTSAFADLGAPVQADAIGLTARIRGSALDPIVTATLAASAVRAKDLPALQLDLPLRFENGRGSIEHGRVSIAGAKIQIDGSALVLDEDKKPIEKPTVEAHVKMVDLPLGPFVPDVDGKVGLTVDVNGALPIPNGQVVLQVSKTRAAHVQLQPITAKAVLKDGKVTVRPFAVTLASGGTTHIEANASPLEQTFAAKVSGRGVVLDALAKGADVPLRGALRFVGSAEGTFDAPKFEGRAVASKLVFEDTSLGSITATVAGDLKRVATGVILQGPSGTAKLGGHLDVPKQNVDAYAHVRKLQIATLLAVAKQDLPVDAVTETDLHIVGALPYPEVSGTIRTKGLALDDKPVPGGDAQMQIGTPNPGRYRVRFDAFKAIEANVDATMEPLAVRARVDLKDLQTTSVIPPSMAPPVVVSTTGRIDAVYENEKPQVKLQLSKLDVTTLKSGKPVANLSATRPVLLQVNGPVAVIEQCSLEGSAGRVQVSGPAGEMIDVKVEGDIDPAFVVPFVEPITAASGKVAFEARASGPANKPAVAGSVYIAEPVRVRPRKLIREAKVESGRINITQHKVKLESVTGKIGTGSFSATGTVTLSNLKPAAFDLRMGAENLAMRMGDLNFETAADLQFVGPAESPELQGELSLLGGRYNREFELRDFNFVATDPVIEEADTEPSPLLEQMKLKLHAISANSMRVKIQAGAMGVDSTFGANLRIAGTAARPQVDGEVTSRDGRIKFPAGKLEVTHIQLDFAPTVEKGINPVIDLLAEGEVEDSEETKHLVTMQLSGPMDAMKLQFSSPKLNELAVMTLLLTGASVDELLAGNESSNTANTALAFAGSQLAGPITRFLEKRLEDALNVKVKLKTEISETQVEVRASHDVTRRIQVEGSYQKDFYSRRQVTTARGRLWITDWLFVEGEAGQTTGISQDSDRSSGLIEMKFRVIGEP